MFNFEEPRHFHECFPGNEMENTHLVAYLAIIDGASSPTPTRCMPEKHHIVPREWMTANIPDFSFQTEDPSNVVYLSVKNKIMALQYLTLFFLDMRDSVVYKALTQTIARRYHLGWYDFWRSPYLEGPLIRFLAEKRSQELKGKKRKYGDEYLSKCLEIYSSEPDKKVAFNRVRDEMGFRFSQRTLLDQFRKRFGGIKT